MYSLGIGLTLVHRLVTLHGGQVEAKSEGIGHGSEFIIRLPLVETMPPMASAAQTNLDLSRLNAHRILVVDDNRDSAASLAMLLMPMTAETRSVNDGLAALEAIKTFRPEVVLLDIGMPDMDGYEVARRIRQLPEGHGIAIIALTGWGQEDDRARSKKAGFNYHLVKPVNLGVLKELLVAISEKK